MFILNINKQDFDTKFGEDEKFLLVSKLDEISKYSGYDGTILDLLLESFQWYTGRILCGLKLYGALNVRLTDDNQIIRCGWKHEKDKFINQLVMKTINNCSEISDIIKEVATFPYQKHDVVMFIVVLYLIKRFGCNRLIDYFKQNPMMSPTLSYIHRSTLFSGEHYAVSFDNLDRLFHSQSATLVGLEREKGRLTAENNSLRKTIENLNNQVLVERNRYDELYKTHCRVCEQYEFERRQAEKDSKTLSQFIRSRLDLTK